MEFGVMIWGRTTECFVLPPSHMKRLAKMHEEYLICIGGKDKEKAYEISEKAYKICRDAGKHVDLRELPHYRVLFTFYLKRENPP